MPLTLSSISNEVKPLVVQYGGETVKAHYLPGKVTPRVVDRLSDLSGTDSGKVACETLAQVLVDFDITDDSGATVAPTVDVLLDLPFALNLEFIKAISEAATPSNDPNASTASEGSF